jgi:hypothetical protein
MTVSFLGLCCLGSAPMSKPEIARPDLLGQFRN